MVYGPALVRPLQRLPNLEVLQGGKFHLDAAAVAELTGLSALTKLDLSSCKLGSSALEVLPAAVAQLPRLHSLSLPEGLEDALAHLHAECVAFFEALCGIDQLGELTFRKFKDRSLQDEIAALSQHSRGEPN